jgi:hypothetical protein
MGIAFPLIPIFLFCSAAKGKCQVQAKNEIHRSPTKTEGSPTSFEELTIRDIKIHHRGGFFCVKITGNTARLNPVLNLPG